jgi:hypothetical protein
VWDVVATGLGVSISYATLLRAPQEAYKSRQTFYTGRRQPSSAVAGWVNTMLQAERATRGTTRTFPRYDDLLQDWAPTISRICTELELPILEKVTADQQRAVNQLIDPTLRRSPRTWEDSDVHPQVSAMADEVWSLFDRLPSADATETAEIMATLDLKRDEYAAFYAFAESVAESSIVRIAPATKNGPKPGAANASGTPTLTRRVKRKVKRLVAR